MMRKLGTLLFAFMLLGALSPELPEHIEPVVDDVPAPYASGWCGDHVTWALSLDGPLTVSGSGPMWDFDYFGGRLPPWYEHRDWIFRAVIGDGVTTLGDWAFYRCAHITRVDLPEGLESIGDGAFAACRSLRSIDLPDSVETMGHSAFAYCLALERMDLPASLREVPRALLFYCNRVTRVTIPAGVEAIGPPRSSTARG